LKLATLLYIKNIGGDFLLIERTQKPNRGFWSPPGGKLITDIAESPFACAVREMKEECGFDTKTADWTLRGIVTEKNYPDIGNLMLFAMEYGIAVNEIPPESPEGKFGFFNPSIIRSLHIPPVDKLYLWDFVLNNKKSVFCIDVDCNDGKYTGKIEK